MKGGPQMTLTVGPVRNANSKQQENQESMSLLIHTIRSWRFHSSTLSRPKGIRIPKRLLAWGGWLILLIFSVVGLSFTVQLWGGKWELDMFGSGMNLITTVVGFGMSATFIVFVCTRLICGRLRAAESRQMFEIDSTIDPEQPEHRISGLAPVTVAAIPTLKFNREAFSSMEDAQCTICLGEYQEKEVLRIMPKCGHNFHLSCIDVWLRKQATCPVCRLPLHDSLEAKRFRPAMFDMTRRVENTEISVDRSQHWLLPGTARSEGNGSNQISVESVHGNSVSAISGEAETRL